MTDMYERLSKLADAAEDANNDFDILAFEQGAFPVGGDCFGTYLAANLDFLREELRALAMEFYGVTA